MLIPTDNGWQATGRPPQRPVQPYFRGACIVSTLRSNDLSASNLRAAVNREHNLRNEAFFSDASRTQGSITQPIVYHALDLEISLVWLVRSPCQSAKIVQPRTLRAPHRSSSLLIALDLFFLSGLLCAPAHRSLSLFVAPHRPSSLFRRS